MTDEMKAKREKLFSSPKNGYDLVDQAALEAMEAYCETYKQYLDNGKTERECAAYTVELAQAQGYVPYQRGMSLKPGDKVYRVNRGKSVMLARTCPTARRSWPATLTPPVWTSSPIPCMRTATLPMARLTITAASASISGWPSPWSCGAWWSCGTAPW